MKKLYRRIDTMFGLKADIKMPDEFLTNHQVWDDYVSSVWQQVLSLYEFDKDSVIVELGPGSSTKIGGALAKMSFSGRLYVVDALPSVIESLKLKYKALLPNAEIHFIQKRFIESIEDLPSRVDYIFASHVLDDMMSSEYITEKVNQLDSLSWCSKYEDIPTESFQEIWVEILKDKTYIEKISKSVLNDIKEILGAISCRHFIFNQYPSSTLYDNDMAFVNKYAFEILRELKNNYKTNLIETSKVQEALNRLPNYNNDHIGRHILNAEYWMVG